MNDKHSSEHPSEHGDAEPDQPKSERDPEDSSRDLPPAPTPVDVNEPAPPPRGDDGLDWEPD